MIAADDVGAMIKQDNPACIARPVPGLAREFSDE
jgi:hypothetical protein